MSSIYEFNVNNLIAKKMCHSFSHTLTENTITFYNILSKVSNGYIWQMRQTPFKLGWV